MNAIQKHVLKFPSARTTTIAYLEARERTTKQLQAEIEAAKRVNVSLARRLLTAIGWRR